MESSTQGEVDPYQHLSNSSTTSIRSVRTSPQSGQISAPLTSEESKAGDDDDTPMTSPASAAMVHLPVFINWLGIIGLIFGGCCSNAIRREPESGLLITFVQFVVTALVTCPTYFSARRPPSFLKPRQIPLPRLVLSASMFFAVNMLNNFAFGYSISIPVHIILRSGGSVMTMLVGYVWGKRYTGMQIFSVAMLTAGIGVAATADAQAKVNIDDLLLWRVPLCKSWNDDPQGKMNSTSSTRFDSEFITGLSILAVAQLLSAIMGIYTELTYSRYGRFWHENLFYQHCLSIPMFCPFFPSLLEQFKKLVHSEPIRLSSSLSHFPHLKADSLFDLGKLRLPSMTLSPSVVEIALPKHLFNLAVNAGTQFACIRGVNALSARTSALGVSIVLNVRKLVSLCLSLWLFGNKLPPGVLLGAAIVFGSTSIWAWEGQRIGRKNKNKAKVQ